MDEEVDKKLEEDQDVIKRLITRFTDEGKQRLHRNLRGLICDFADHQPGRYGDEEIDEESEELRYKEKLKKLDDHYIIRYDKIKCNLKDKCPACEHATVTTVLPSKGSGPGFSDMSSDKIIPPQCTSRVSGDTFDCKYEFDKSEGQGTELVITCKTKNVIYLVTCQDCEEQFVGRTSHSSSLNSIDLLRDNDEVKEHFSLTEDQNEEDSEKEDGQQSDKCEKFSVQIIQKLPGSQTDGDCIDRERDQWIKKLMTYYPYGMNSRLEENEKPLYSEKFFDLFNDSSITSRKNKDEIVKELLAVLDSEDSRPISNFDSVLNIVAQSQNTDRNVRLDVKNEYIDGERNISNENKKLDDLIKDVLLRWCGVEYEACSSKSSLCITCDEVDKSSDEKYDCIYEFSEGEEMVVSCTTEKVIYLLTCTQCKEQYVGLTKNPFKTQMNNYRSTRKTGQGPSELRKRLHNKKKDCPSEKFYSKIIQKLPRSMDKEDLKKYKLDWIEKLDTLKPSGLNVSGSRSKLSDKSSITAEMNRLDISDQNDFLPDKSSTPRK